LSLESIVIVIEGHSVIDLSNFHIVIYEFLILNLVESVLFREFQVSRGII